MVFKTCQEFAILLHSNITRIYAFTIFRIKNSIYPALYVIDSNEKNFFLT